MQLKNVKFVKSCVLYKDFPNLGLDEVALIGQSNVGKSSFINLLANNKNLAKTSSKPGKTRTLNLYNVNDKFLLIDIPGYGYANVSVAQSNEFEKIITDYLGNSKKIKSIYLFVDARRNIDEEDIIAAELVLGQANPLNVYVVASKCDKLNQSERYHLNNKIYEGYSNSNNDILKNKKYQIIHQSFKDNRWIDEVINNLMKDYD